MVRRGRDERVLDRVLPRLRPGFGDDASGNQEHWSGRMPPQDSDAEQSVLGSMLISKDAIADVNEQIGGADFYRPAHETDLRRDRRPLRPRRAGRPGHRLGRAQPSR